MSDLQNMFSVNFTGLTNDLTYYARVYPMNPKGFAQAEIGTQIGNAMPVAGLDLAHLPTGTAILLNVNGVAKRFLVVQQGVPSSLYDSSCDGTWLLMEELYEKRALDSTNNDYENSDLHTYLNNSFVSLFDSGVRSLIKQVKIPYRKGTGTSGSDMSGANGLSAKIFILSAYEVGWTTADGSMPVDGACLDYFEGAATKDPKRIAYLNGSANIWHTRTPYTYGGSAATRQWEVDSVGYYSNSGSCTGSYGVRPALVLPSDVRVGINPNADGSYSLM